MQRTRRCCCSTQLADTGGILGWKSPVLILLNRRPYIRFALLESPHAIHPAGAQELREWCVHLANEAAWSA